ncbi:PorP/SprF family type IX secretion system membrane protein [Odoribacter sp. OttesenSCG-928-J03]|nr:PorP/SprF family type IX secretion system membrane protein [Odoribacter sp. OttesenSCG-928-J03]MDL2330543.1 PorP/SprF family type IX secretion system membrane protein [Odoribacter sp. OttesenSCG-928-A06]
MSQLFKAIFSACLLLIWFVSPVAAQDYNFSQFWENRTYYNPAFVGLHEGEWNNNLTYRRLWPNLDGDFSTINFSSDFKTYNNYGIGLNVISSDEGAGLIKSTSVALAYSWRGYISKERGFFFQLGVKGSYNHEKLNSNKWIFSGQLDPIYGNIYPDYNGVGVIKKQQNFWDFSLGALFSLPIRLPNYNVIENYIGFSVDHFTRPKNNFLEDKQKIPMKLGVQWYASVPTSLYSLNKKSRLQVRPGIIFENQGDKLLSKASFNNLLIGADVATDPLFAGIWYSSQLLSKSDKNYKALVFKMGLKFDSDSKRFQYKLTYTYDMSLGNLVKSTEGSHEIGISVVYRFNARYNYNIFSF